MKKIRVGLKSRSYDILIAPGLLDGAGRVLKGLGLGTDAVIVTNKQIFALYGRRLETSLNNAGFRTSPIIIPSSEKAKAFSVVAPSLNKIAENDRFKNVFMVALGGGVVGDFTGFISSIYRRGVPYVQIPTTLLAQVDSAIGGKTAVDLPSAKNMAGTFYQPRIVISDPSVLKSLPRRHIINAMAEIIKYGVIKDVELFEFLEKNHAKALSCDPRTIEYVVSRCSAIKAAVVERDEFDKEGARAVLNYGHTVGHAIEAAAGYSHRYAHGEAVAIGMVVAAEIAFTLKILRAEDAFRIIALIKEYSLPVTIKRLGFEKIYSALGHDKKFIHGKNRFVLPCGIGRTKFVEGVPESIIRNAITRRIVR